MVIGLVIADAVGGVAGHVLALVGWVAGAALLFRTARSGAGRRARIGARIGVAVCALLAVIAGLLAVSGAGSSSSADQGTVAPVCYATATSDLGTGGSFTLAYAATDCTQIANAVDVSLAAEGYTATPNTSKGPGSVICDGLVSGNLTTVIATEPDAALCEVLGLSIAS